MSNTSIGACPLFPSPISPISLFPPGFSTDFLFSGEYWDDDAKLYLFAFSQYDPYLARWTTREPSRRDGPNYYQYGFGRPVCGYDMLGLDWDWYWKIGEVLYDMTEWLWPELPGGPLSSVGCAAGTTLDSVKKANNVITYVDMYQLGNEAREEMLDSVRRSRLTNGDPDGMIADLQYNKDHYGVYQKLAEDIGQTFGTPNVPNPVCKLPIH